MEHPHANPIVKTHGETARAVHRHVDGVFPLERADGLPCIIERLEEEAMQVERVCELHLGIIGDGPNLSPTRRGTQRTATSLPTSPGGTITTSARSAGAITTVFESIGCSSRPPSPPMRRKRWPATAIW